MLVELVLVMLTIHQLVLQDIDLMARKYLNPKNLRCDICKKKFVLPYNLEIHKKYTHELLPTRLQKPNVDNVS